MISEELSLGEYPYTYARVSVMKADLIKKPDYDKLLKLSLSGSTKFLEESVYKKEIDELALSYSGVPLLEHALRLNLSRTYKKILKICPPDLQSIISVYLERRVMENIKVILRAHLTSLSKEEVEKMIVPVGIYSKEFYFDLIEKDTVEEILGKIKMIDMRKLRGELEDFQSTKSLVALENALDRIVWKRVFMFSKRILEQGNLFRKFLLMLLEVENLKTILRLTREGVSPETMRELVPLFGVSYKLSPLQMKALVDATTLKNTLGVLSGTYYSEAFQEELRQSSDSLIPFEHALDVRLLHMASRFIHSHPMSVDVILGYLFLKEIEVKNLRTIVKGKQLGVSEKFMEKSIVM